MWWKRPRCRTGTSRALWCLTLLISTILYVAIAAIAISAVSIERLSSSPAPLSLVFREVAGISPRHDQRHRDCRDAEHDSWRR